MQKQKIAVWDEEKQYYFSIFEKKPIVGKIISLPLQNEELTKKLVSFNEKKTNVEKQLMSLFSELKSENSDKDNVMQRIKEIEKEYPNKPFIKKKHYQQTRFRVVGNDGKRTILEPLTKVPKTNKS